jgi:hypothetical protein
VRVLTGNPEFNGVKLRKVPGQHGSDTALQVAYEGLQEVCGIVFSHQDEKTLYLAGDTVWNDYVASNIACYRPEVIILNAGDAQVPGLGNIIMNAAEVVRVCEAAPAAMIVATHFEAVNHAVAGATTSAGSWRSMTSRAAFWFPTTAKPVRCTFLERRTFSMNVEDTKKLVRKFYEAIGRRDFDARGEFCHKDFVFYTQVDEPKPGLTGFINSEKASFDAFESFRFPLEQVIVEGDKVGAYLIFEGEPGPAT